MFRLEYNKYDKIFMQFFKLKCYQIFIIIMQGNFLYNTKKCACHLAQLILFIIPGMDMYMYKSVLTFSVFLINIYLLHISPLQIGIVFDIVVGHIIAK